MSSLAYRMPHSLFSYDSPLIDRFFTEPYHSAGWGNYTQETTEDAYLLDMTIPGVDRDTLKIKAQENKLYIQAERGQDKIDTTFKLPADVNPKKISAKYTDGILKVTFQKIKAPEGKEIPISF